MGATHLVQRIPADFFVKRDRLDLKFIRNSRDSEYNVAETVCKKKNKVGRLILPDFKTNRKAAVVKQTKVKNRENKNTLEATRKIYLPWTKDLQ